jgi:hypothetical protein
MTHVAERRNVCRCLVGKPIEKRPLRRPRCRWKCDIKMDLRGMEGVDWIQLAGDRGKC